MYTKALEDFSVQLIGHNYFLRSDLKHSPLRQQPRSMKTNQKSDFMTVCIVRIRNLFSQQSLLLSQARKQMGQLIDDKKRLKAELAKVRNERIVVKEY